MNGETRCFAVTQVTRKVTSNQCWTRWLQNTWIATLCCETSWELSCSWIGQEDREPPSPTNLFNEICKKTKPTIRSVRRQREWFRTWGSVEMFELFETGPKDARAKNAYHTGVKASSIAHRGHLVKEIAANRGIIEYTLDLLSIPEYVIKKGRPHGHRYGKTPEKKENHLAHNLKKRFIKIEFQRDPRDCFLRDPDFRKAYCSNMFESEEVLHQIWTSFRTRISPITWRNQNIFDTNKIGGSLPTSLVNTGPLRNRSDFN